MLKCFYKLYKYVNDKSLEIIATLKTNTVTFFKSFTDYNVIIPVTPHNITMDGLLEWWILLSQFIDILLWFYDFNMSHFVFKLNKNI